MLKHFDRLKYLRDGALETKKLFLMARNTFLMSLNKRKIKSSQTYGTLI